MKAQMFYVEFVLSFLDAEIMLHVQKWAVKADSRWVQEYSSAVIFKTEINACNCFTGFSFSDVLSPNLPPGTLPPPHWVQIPRLPEYRINLPLLSIVCQLYKRSCMTV